MNAFHAEPHAGAFAERVHVRRGDRTPIGVDEQIAASDKVQAGMIEVVVGEIVDGHALRRQSVPVVQIHGKQRRHTATGRMRQIVLADLPAIVGEAVRVRL